jgi:hypothetical protein
VVRVAEITTKPPPEKRFGTKTNQVWEFTRKSLVGESVAVGEVEMTGVVVEEVRGSEVVLGAEHAGPKVVGAVLGTEHSGHTVVGAVLGVEHQVSEGAGGCKEKCTG